MGRVVHPKAVSRLQLAAHLYEGIGRGGVKVMYSGY